MRRVGDLVEIKGERLDVYVLRLVAFKTIDEIESVRQVFHPEPDLALRFRQHHIVKRWEQVNLWLGQIRFFRAILPWLADRVVEAKELLERRTQNDLLLPLQTLTLGAQMYLQVVPRIDFDAVPRGVLFVECLVEAVRILLEEDSVLHQLNR